MWGSIFCRRWRCCLREDGRMYLNNNYLFKACLVSYDVGFLNGTYWCWDLCLSNIKYFVRIVSITFLLQKIVWIPNHVLKRAFVSLSAAFCPSTNPTEMVQIERIEFKSHLLQDCQKPLKNSNLFQIEGKQPKCKILPFPSFWKCQLKSNFQLSTLNVSVYKNLFYYHPLQSTKNGCE